MWALALIAPLILFLLVNFILPIGVLLFRSVEDPEVPSVLPHTAAIIGRWDGQGLPDDKIVATFVEELARAKANETLSAIANRLNYDTNGFRGLILRTARQLPSASSATTALSQLVNIDPRWGDRAYWAVIKHAAGPYTSFYLLAALDRRINADGRIIQTPAEQRIFVDIFLRTFWLSLIVTTLCLFLGYPVAYLLANMPVRIGNLLLILVLLPFWTSVLVRTTAWVVILQREGMVNGLLRWIGATSEPLQLIYNRTGVVIAMTHVLLPFMILPIYGVMKGIGPASMRAALSLGARPVVAFRRVYLPQTVPGISAGCLLVFILALGFYVTPALVGGADDQLISYFIAFYTNQTLNWGMAAALAVILLAATLVLYVLYGRLTVTTDAKWA